MGYSTIYQPQKTKPTAQCFVDAPIVIAFVIVSILPYLGFCRAR